MYDTSKTKILKATTVLKYKKFTQLNLYNRESNYFALFFIEKTIVNFIVLSIKILEKYKEKVYFIKDKNEIKKI